MPPSNTPIAPPSRTAYGGQAVIEGVMFVGRTAHVTAMRRHDGTIGFFETPKKEIRWVLFLRRIPFIRGIVALIEASAKGAVHFNHTAEVYATDQSGAGESSTQSPTIAQKVTLVVGVAVVGVLSFLFGKLLFTLLPAAIEQWAFGGLFDNQFWHNLIEGMIKMCLLVGYILLIAQTPMIKRLFQYHGAEHKVISAYEAGDPLTVDRVQRYSTFHYRCGSSFIVLTVIVGVLLYSLPVFEWESLTERLLIRLALLPVVIGVSFEVLYITNRVRAVPLLRYLGYPGIWLQVLTTKQPTNEQVEVAIAAFERMRAGDERAQPVHT